MAGEVGSLRVTLGLDSIDFTRGMQEINRKLTALNSEFKTTTAGVGRFDNSLDTLRQRSSILTSTLQTHRVKVNELNNQYRESVAVNGATAASTERLLIQYNNAVTAMRRTENQLQQTNRKIQEQSNGFRQLSQEVNASVDRITQQMRVLDSSFDAATAGIRDFGNSTQQLQQRSDHLTSSLRLQQQRVEELNRLHRESVREMGANARETQELEIRLNRATQAMRETEAQLRRTNNQIDNQSNAWNRFNSRLSSVGEQMQHIGGRMQSLGSEIAQSFGMAFLAVGGALGLTAKKAMDFEAQMSSVKSVMAPDEINEFGASLEKLALQMGAETKYSAIEAAQGIEELIKAGLSPAQVAAGGLEGALSLATAGELELADAAEIASTALNAFKDDNLSVMRAADLLAGAANASATSVSEMKFGLSMVSAVASGVGLTFEDTAGALATFAQNGLKGSDAGTSLKTMLLNLSPSTKEAPEQMAKLGLLTKKGTSDFYDANGSIKSMSEIAELLKTKLANLTDEQRQMALKTMFGTDAIRAANILYKEGADGITHMVEAMNKIKSADVAAQKLDNVKGRILLLKGTLETAAIAIGNSLLPAIDKVVAVIQKAVDAFNNLSPKMQSFITIGAVVSAAFLGIVTAIGVALAIIGTAVSGFGALVTVMSTISAPIVLTVAAIAGLGLAFMALWKNSETFRDGVTNVFNSIKNVAIQVFGVVSSFVQEKLGGIKTFWDANGGQFLAAVENVFNGIKAVIEFIMPAVLFIVKMAWTAIKQVIDGALNVIMGLMKIFSGIFTGDFKKMWEGVKQIFKGAIDVVIGWMTLTFVGGLRTLLTNLAKLGVNLVKGLADGIVGLFKTFTTTGTNLANGMVNGVLGFFRNLYTQATSIFGTLRTFGASIWNSISQTILGIARNIWTSVVTNFTNMVSSIRNIFGTVRSVISSIWDNVMAFFKGINLTQIGKDIIQGLINGIGSMASAVWEKVKAIADSVKDTLKNALDINSPSRVTRSIGGYTGEGLVLGMEDMVSRIKSAATKMAKAAIPSIPDTFTGQKINSLIKPLIQGNSLSGLSSNIPNSYDYSKTMYNTIQITTASSDAQAVDRTLRRLAFEF